LLYPYLALSLPRFQDLSRSIVHRPQCLTLHTLHHALCIESDDERIGREIVIHELVGLEPVLVELVPRVASKGLAIVLQHGHVVFVVGQAVAALVLVGKRGRIKSKVAVGREELVGHELGAVADPAGDLDAGAGVDGEGEGGVAVMGTEGAGEVGGGLGFGGGFGGFELFGGK
jgi:hypothetical protein